MLPSWQIKGNNYRMVIFTWFLFLVPPLEWKIRHLFMNKSTCVKVVGSSTICQGTYEESCPSGHLAISRQILGVDCRTKREANLQPLLLQLGKSLTADLGRFPQMRERFMKSNLPEGRFQHAIGAMEMVRTTSTELPSPKERLYNDDLLVWWPLL